MRETIMWFDFIHVPAETEDGFPRALVLFETSQLLNLTGAWTNTHSLEDFII